MNYRSKLKLKLVRLFFVMGLVNHLGLMGCTFKLTQVPISEPSTTALVVVQITSAIGLINVGQLSNYNLSGTCEGVSDFKLKIDSHELATINCTDGLWMTQADLSMQSDGNLNLTLVTRDGGTILDQKVAIKDSTPPTLSGVVLDGDFNASTSSSPTITWPVATDAISGLDFYELALGTTVGGTEVSGGWMNMGSLVSTALTAYTYANGTRYFVSVRARDRAGNSSASLEGNGWVVDVSPPSVPAGLDEGDAWSTLTSTPVASWEAVTDSGSGFAKYQFSVGTSPGATDISGWQDTTSTSAQIGSGLSLNLGNAYYFNVRALDVLGNTSGVASSNGWLVVPQATLVKKSDAAFNWNSYYKVATPGVACVGTESYRRDCAHGGERRVMDLPSFPDCTNLSVKDSLDVFYWRCDVSGGHAVFTSIKLKEGKGLKNLISPSGAWRAMHATLYHQGVPVGATASSQWWTNTILPLPLNDGSGPMSLSTRNVIYYISSDQSTSGYYVDASGVGFVSLNSATLRLSTSSSENCHNTFGNPGTDTKAVFCTREKNFNWYEMNIQTTNSSAQSSIVNYLANFNVFKAHSSGRADNTSLSKSLISEVIPTEGYYASSPYQTVFENISSNTNLDFDGDGSGNVFQRINVGLGAGMNIGDGLAATNPSKAVAISSASLSWYSSPNSTINNAVIMVFNLIQTSRITISNTFTVGLLSNMSTLSKLTSLWLLGPSPVCFSSGDSGFTTACAIGGASNAVKVNGADSSQLNNKTGDGVSQNAPFVPGGACPAAVDGNKVATNRETVAITYLLNAYEILDDEIGNDDGLCEGNEDCIYMPNFGANQGSGDFYSNGTCTFVNGAVTNVRMYAFPNP